MWYPLTAGCREKSSLVGASGSQFHWMMAAPLSGLWWLAFRHRPEYTLRMLATNSLSIRYDPSTGTAPCSTPTLRHMQVDLVAIVVEDYDPAITFFVDVLGFELVEDSPSLTNDGRPKRWVVVRPPGGQTGVLLARADGEHQRTAIGNQVAGRVGFFLRLDDF